MAPPVETPSHPDSTPDAPQPAEEARENEQPELENADDNEGGSDDVEREQIEQREEKHMFDDDIEMPDEPSKEVDNGEHTNELSEELHDMHIGKEDTLFSSIYTTPACIPGLVSPWMTHIQTNGPAAVASILSLVVSISRVMESPPDDVILPSHVIANDPKATVKHVHDVIVSDLHGRVLITAKDTASRRIRRAYEDFWRRIAAEATDVVLYDTDCFDTLISWLDAMAGSPSRSLRLAASLGAYRMVDGFVEKGNKLRKQLATMQRQLNTEKRRCGVDDKRKKVGKELSQKGKELVKKVDDLTANNSELIVLADKVFRTVFVVKYRDISADIRNVSVAALGGWILSFPDHFLDDSNNKYIGWLLSDKDPVVRKSSLDALLRMLKKKDFFPSLELFLKRFSHRIVEMTRDKDDHVSVGAITLLTALIEHGIVQGEACEQVCGTAVEEPHTEIRRAAGEFMARLIVSHYGQEKPTAQPKRGRAARTSDGIFNPGLGEIPSPRLSREYLKELLFAVLRNVDEPSTPFFAVDSVWDSFPAVRCWQAFSDLLLEHAEPPPAKGKGRASRKGKVAIAEDEDGLNDFDKSILCEMLLASATEASGNGDATRARLVEKGERLNPEPPSVLLSQHFLPLLPKLLSQFQTDLRALRSLVKLPIHFSLKVFDQDGQDTHFMELLGKIIDVLTRNTGSPEVSAACAESLRSLLSDQNPLRQQTITALQAGCIEAAKELAIQVRSNLSESQPEDVASAILRVRILSELVAPGSSVEESVIKLFEYQLEQTDTSDLGDEVTVDVARTASALTIWSLARVRSRLETFSESSNMLEDMQELEEVKDLRRLGSSVINLLLRAFSSSSLAIFPRVMLLQAFLTMSTLARGIEKQASTSENENRNSDEHQPEKGDLDLLDIRGNTAALVKGLRTCVTELILHQLGLKNQSRPSDQKQKQALPDEDVRNCFASLVQASFQSPFSNDISHFPLLGLLLKFSAKDVEPAVTEFTAFQLCRKYCQQRQLRESSLLKDEVRALQQVTGFDIDEEKRYNLVRELSEALISSRQHAELKITAAQDLLKSLMDGAIASEEEQLSMNVELLSNAGFPLCSHLSETHAKGLLEKSKEIQIQVDEKLADEESADVARLFDTLHIALESVANGETPVMPKPRTKSIAQRKKKRTKKRRRTATSGARQIQSPIANSQGVRRSSREKRRINYARMQDRPSESEDASDEANSSGDDDDQGTQEESPQNAAEMARDLMRYSSSPRNPARVAPASQNNARSSRKRGRASKQRNSPQTKPSIKPGSDSPRLHEPANGIRRSSRNRRSSARALASQESHGTPTKSQRGNIQEAENRNESMETDENQQVPDNNTQPVEDLPASSSAPLETSGDQEPNDGMDADFPDQDATGSGKDATQKEKGSEDENDEKESDDGKADEPAKVSSDQGDQREDHVEPLDRQPLSAEQNGLEAAGAIPESESPSLSNPEPETQHDSDNRNHGNESGRSSQQSPRRSTRRKASTQNSSPAKSRSPAKGRIRKSPPKNKVGETTKSSQMDKENVSSSPLNNDDASKLSKIRRRRRRQW